MRIGMTSIGNILVGCLFVTKKEMREAHKCENCGIKPIINHPDLAKEELDWCLECNDQKYLKEYTQEQYNKYCIEKTMEGKAVIIAVEA